MNHNARVNQHDLLLSSSAKSSCPLKISTIWYSIPKYTESSVVTSSINSAFSVALILNRATSPSLRVLEEQKHSYEIMKGENASTVIPE